MKLKTRVSAVFKAVNTRRSTNLQALNLRKLPSPNYQTRCSATALATLLEG